MKIPKKKKIGIGLLGLGTVGTGVYRILTAYKEDLQKQTGVEIEIMYVLVRDPQKKRRFKLPADQITTQVHTILSDPKIDVIIEVMGGIHPAKEWILQALECGKHVVTANKDLMAEHGQEILAKAREKHCDIYYEASVAGGIPILRALQDSFSSDRVTKIMGIINGTTNYILSKMSREGIPYHEALQEAQALGYAESDPYADVEGLDAARKLVILSTLGFRVPVELSDVEVRGITRVTPEDINYAKKLGYVVKLVGIAEREEGLSLSVEPMMIHRNHPLASVEGVFNAVYIYGEAVGETMFYGPGAGELPTATAVVSDLVSIIQRINSGVNGFGLMTPYDEKRLKNDAQKRAKYFLRLLVEEQKGVMVQVMQRFITANVSIEQMIQQPEDNGKTEIILVTKQTTRKNFYTALAMLQEWRDQVQVQSSYRVMEAKEACSEIPSRQDQVFVS